MKVLVSSEYRFFHVPHQGYFTSASFPYSFWTRYLDVFERVEILARALPVTEVGPRWKRVDGERVGFVAVPHYVGPVELLRNIRAVTSAIAEAASTRDAVILRLASALGMLLERRLAAEARPFGVELVGDPYSTFARGAIRHPARPVLRHLFTYSTRASCRRACAVAYVTKHALQQRYPPSPSAFTTDYSSIELAEDAFIDPGSRAHRSRGPYVVTCVGSLEQMYKAPDVLIKSAHSLQQAGIDVRLRIIGDGRHRPELETYVRRLGMTHAVNFCGHIAPEQVRAELDDSDLFVLPSRTEGTPRALIEAMARGLPAIATRVGGVPELLDDDCLVNPSDATALAHKIRLFLTQTERRASAGELNLSRARSFEESLLRPRRNEMYRQVLDRTAHWQLRAAAGCVNAATPSVVRYSRTAMNPLANPTTSERSPVELVCPRHHQPVAYPEGDELGGFGKPWKDGTLVCSAGCTVQVIGGIPRFVPRSTYADSFGLQWRRYRHTQLDSYTGCDYSRQRLERSLGMPLSDLRDQRVLEVGCGAGRFTEHLARFAGTLASIDLSDAVEANAETMRDREPYLLAQADARKAPFRPGLFDVVVCLGVLQHTPSAVETLGAFFQLVRPGGLVVVDNYRGFSGWRTAAEYLTVAYPLRALLTRLSPEAALRATKALTRACDPVRKRTVRYRSLDLVVSRLFPTACYYEMYPELPERVAYEWNELDTHDGLTDAHKHRMTTEELRDSLIVSGFDVLSVGPGGNGIEARARRPGATS